ncbi:hypothetical protein Tco_1404442 [Tanacetum coccineum]
MNQPEIGNGPIGRKGEEAMKKELMKVEENYMWTVVCVRGKDISYVFSVISCAGEDGCSWEKVLHGGNMVAKLIVLSRMLQKVSNANSWSSFPKKANASENRPLKTASTPPPENRPLSKLPQLPATFYYLAFTHEIDYIKVIHSRR